MTYPPPGLTITRLMTCPSGEDRVLAYSYRFAVLPRVVNAGHVAEGEFFKKRS